ncbi:cyclic AMP-dependent transcription factor ATF-6alpha [Striga asiatica]|uniref:Cyclic AMP-dependent transcription factor ATF-6alpha n=1 Tax=Striga asiatica TaxID=4170 RepID=A0A5A7PRB5_STRAF|nr:cyclic AMP-dependent transcription factor ATF-6alpha [Striga asiatica]
MNLPASSAAAPVHSTVSGGSSFSCNSAPGSSGLSAMGGSSSAAVGETGHRQSACPCRGGSRALVTNFDFNGTNGGVYDGRPIFYKEPEPFEENFLGDVGPILIARNQVVPFSTDPIIENRADTVASNSLKEDSLLHPLDPPRNPAGKISINAVSGNEEILNGMEVEINTQMEGDPISTKPMQLLTAAVEPHLRQWPYVDGVVIVRDVAAPLDKYPRSNRGACSHIFVHASASLLSSRIPVILANRLYE